MNDPTLTLVAKRLVRLETLLFKLAMHLGMNPKSGQPLRKEPMDFIEEVHAVRSD